MGSTDPFKSTPSCLTQPCWFLSFTFWQNKEFLDLSYTFSISALVISPRILDSLFWWSPIYLIFFCAISQKSLLTTNVFSLKFLNFMFTFRSMICLQFMLICGIKHRSRSILHMDVLTFPPLLLRRLFFVLRCPCQVSVVHVCLGFFLASLFYSTDLFVCFYADLYITVKRSYFKKQQGRCSAGNSYV